MATFPVILSFLSLLAIGFGLPTGCPYTDDLSPCSCKRLPFGLQVVCANFNSSHHLIKAFRILKDYQVHTVLLHALHIPEFLPSDLFDGLKIKEMRVEKSNLRFSQPAFKGLDASLYVLNVAEQSHIKSRDRFSLAKLTRLHELYVQSNNVEKVEDTWLNEKVPNVEKLVLDSNDISDMEEHAFANLASLKVISLADNRIKRISRSMFPKPATHLMRIDLSYNEISSLPGNFFEDMPSLTEIILSGNELKTIEQKTWEPVWERLTKILLFDNQIECGENLTWMKRTRRPQIIEGNCAAPKNMIGHPITDVYKT
ncbi:leucine-rich repeat transmembrane protein FLRT2-like [Argiope bruennichi]|uniref:Leucine-rich repeat-containing G-protein like n=1 Tax=Argiope bruennichi TaxID=94029 RepID=A0A8T0FRJ8_ARGBR|nr:leucine-rich repeat transmembrane protein FLRT2-like [Argiope bruennichi]KAF8792788.1 Leucine-rich repeat-containing G-protein like [Argiope bruennichi]